MDIETLINEVQANKCLYDVSSSQYKDSFIKDMAWNSISETMGASVKDCKTKWKSLRDRFIRERRISHTTSGQAAQNFPKWKYYEVLQFLIPFTEHRKTTSNLSDTDTEEIFNADMFSTSTSSEDSYRNKKQKTSNTTEGNDNIDKAILKILSQEKDEAESFVQSLLPTLRRLSPIALQAAKIEINQLLFRLGYGNVVIAQDQEQSNV